MTMSGHCLTAALTALALHHGLFIHGEWHLRAPQLFVAALLLPIAYHFSLPTAAIATVDGPQRHVRIGNTAAVAASFYGTLFASIAVYRLFFHRLGRFPGPRLAALTKFWHLYHARGGRNHLLMERLRKQYGDYVRIGPREIVAFTPDAVTAINRPGSLCTKSAFYDFLLPDIGVVTARNHAFHDIQRRIWTTALSSKNLKMYMPRISEYAQLLAGAVERAAAAEKPVEMSQWFYWFSFDCVGEMFLSRSFGMLQSGEWHAIITLLRNAMGVLGPFTPIPWAARIGFGFFAWAWVMRDFTEMKAWCVTQMKQRLKLGSGLPDVASVFIASAEKSGTPIAQQLAVLNAEAISFLVAGSDTTALTLTLTFYELCRAPQHAEAIYEEVKNVDPFDDQALLALPNLNAVLKEVMRLHPAIPTGGLRDTPESGLTIGDVLIPGDIIISAPRYSVMRSEECFERASEFIPERWTTRPEMVRDERGYFPFSMGRHTCLGKALAYKELRMVVAMLLSRYRVRFAPGADQSAATTGMRDEFTAAPGKLSVCWERRDAGNSKAGIVRGDGLVA